eukprot:CAMPEP_0118634716 /NCGR_PEP_ID=MMETSP0785-20121206/1696_1 /TAXON_ID=91992 /ORGANISM="Bolidomonas pacifica, Strain CCMP 1866" /LENGTH=60 /DNA_ID=CAMNT_0006525711 /DNA_START=23 /DNA_END=205 /DNA_ORIENTATION=-
MTLKHPTTFTSPQSTTLAMTDRPGATLMSLLTPTVIPASSSPNPILREVAGDVARKASSC